MKKRVVAAAGIAALALPAPALAHGRSPVIALDYRVTLTPSTRTLPGVHVSVLDGDRDLRVRVAPGVVLVVRGELGEPFLRIDAGGVWVDASSPTATSDGLVSDRLHGWVHVSGGREVVWHDHRLLAPPASRPGPDGAFAIPILLDGRPALIAGSFTRVARPVVWPWLVAGVLLAAALVAAARRGRAAPTVVLGAAAGVAALAALASFTAPAARAGAGAWLEVGSALALGVVLGALLLRLRAGARLAAAGVVGALAAAVSLSALPVFDHGVVVSVLPATLARLCCGIALECGAAAALFALLGARGVVARSAPRRAPLRAVRR